MVHEFKEYRPWKSMAQFHKEIGKYVDEKEVRRLARYVVIQYSQIADCRLRRLAD